MRRLFDEADRFRRRLRPAGNPIAQVWDRIEAVLLLVLVGGGLLAVPFAAVTGTTSYRTELADAHHGHQPATAITLAEAPRPVVSSDGAGPVDGLTVAARWTDARGLSHRGDVLAAPGSPAGTAVRIWLDAKGASTLAPVTPVGAVFESLFLAGWVWFVPTAVLLLGYRLGRRLLDRRRAADWDRAWAEYAGQRSQP
ncbi:Rv1733c family protein [Amycolatopsis sp. H20-H5]|uniref:Rv1733c family protein n=1 Tax=Amycolatopsis sp. H20-H5 TaxID=3046309 RepID=UPI002DB6E289|nr:hypothetical protein [Amycolatopsis sp. H20-H5]MEC3979680.1 hypothetical protein [Amycolatopsis sp. H20-H5]